jgi:hypothetical protein
MGTETYSDAVAGRVAEAIEAAGETKLGVAEKTGIPRSTLLRRLDRVTPFNTDELDAIAKLLGIDVVVLAGGRRPADATRADVA